MIKLTKMEYKNIINATLHDFQKCLWEQVFDGNKAGKITELLNDGDKKLISETLDVWIAAIERLKTMLEYVDFGK